MIDEYKKVLFKNQEGYPSDQLRGHLLEQYKLYIEMADRISSRRQSANSFFLSLNTTLVALGGCPRTQKAILGQPPSQLSLPWRAKYKLVRGSCNSRYCYLIYVVSFSQIIQGSKHRQVQGCS